MVLRVTNFDTVRTFKRGEINDVTMHTSGRLSHLLCIHRGDCPISYEQA